MGGTFAAGPREDTDVPKVRPYLFYDTAASLCTECLRRVEVRGPQSHPGEPPITR